ncbi:2-C-methyl-D-erythritol 4-phosphate cytidylyltransferase [Clostridia bacterium]|nr:2-C-methyl-D-erythritol 4-phosphate cytidylyltransferase [Clostridia bacterium]
MPQPNKTAAVILAAGFGRRMNSTLQKQYMLLLGYPVLYYSLKAFEESEISSIVLVTGENEIDYCQKKIVDTYGFSKVTHIVPGGAERYHSVFCGLKAIGEADYVLIHDGARPLVTGEIITRCLKGAMEHEAAIAAMPVKDTIKIADDEGFSKYTPPRDKLWQVQTPQAFSFPLIVHAYEQLIAEEEQGIEHHVTDDAMVAELMCGRSVKLVEGSYENSKITTPEDLWIAERLLSGT